MIRRPLVCENTGYQDWYTPSAYIEAARKVLGEIDLDPASSDLAQETVKANTYYTKKTDGLTKDWKGRVWMNPPYARELVGRFISKFIKHVERKDITAGIVLVNNSTETKWHQGMASVSNMVCFPDKRIKFIHDYGKPPAPTQAQSVFYVGANVDDFAKNFQQFGTFMKPLFI